MRSGDFVMPMNVRPTTIVVVNVRKKIHDRGGCIAPSDVLRSSVDGKEEPDFWMKPGSCVSC